ncbi:glycosyltransferase family 1 protein [bacterium]|nr:glycosyltransferase family 1 protein [bacterium]
MHIAMPKILIVIARLNVGGTSQYIGELVSGLGVHGYEVLVATGNVQGAEVEDGVVDQLPIRRICNLGRKISLVADFKARGEIKRLIREFEPDLMYSHTFKAGLLVRSLSTKTPVIHAFHGHLFSEPELAGWKSRVVVVCERLLAPRASALVTVGKKVANELLAEGVGTNSQYRSIAPGVRPLALEKESNARKALGIESEVRPIVVWMARVTAVKAPQRVATIARAIPEARFILAGGGDLMDRIKKNVPSNLSIVGWQPATRMWAVADLAISTSENEGMPVALIEAQLAGIPVVAVDVGSISEVIDDGVTGYVYDEFDEKYIRRVRELILDKAALKALGKQAKERAAREFAPEKLVESHLRLFDEILRR